MGTRGMTRVVSDMDEHSKVKADAKLIVKEAYDAVGSKDDQVIAGFIKVSRRYIRHILHRRFNTGTGVHCRKSATIVTAQRGTALWEMTLKGLSATMQSTSFLLRWENRTCSYINADNGCYCSGRSLVCTSSCQSRRWPVSQL